MVDLKDSALKTDWGAMIGRATKGTKSTKAARKKAEIKADGTVDGRSCAPALRDLYLAGNAVSDLTPLADIKTLESLSLDDNQISDITALAGLPALAWLYLADNDISDLGPLASLPLTQLHAAGNAITDPSPLAGQAMLQSLDLGRNPVGPQISQLGELPWLGELYLSDVGLTQVPLINAMYMFDLDLSANAISDLTPLTDYATLRTVDLTTIEDPSALMQIKDLFTPS